MADEIRCDRCGEICTHEGRQMVCPRCDHLVDSRGRKTRKQRTPSQRVARRLAQPSLFSMVERPLVVQTGRPIPNFEDPSPPRFTARPPRKKRPRCETCDRWYCMRAGRAICIKCGQIRPQ